MRERLLNDLTPICHVCNKEVESLEIFNDYCTDQIVFKAKCHGQIDICTIEPHFFEECNISKGNAFVGKLLNKILSIEAK